MTEFISTTITEGRAVRMTMDLETLLEIMADIELKKRSDPRAVITLLRVLEKADPALPLL